MGVPADDPYNKLKELQQQLEFLTIREGYVKDEMKNLKREMIHAREEVKRVQSVPLIIGTCFLVEHEGVFSRSMCFKGGRFAAYTL